MRASRCLEERKEIESILVELHQKRKLSIQKYKVQIQESNLLIVPGKQIAIFTKCASLHWQWGGKRLGMVVLHMHELGCLWMEGRVSTTYNGPCRFLRHSLGSL